MTTVQEKVFCCFWYYNTRSASSVQKLYELRFRSAPPNKQLIHTWYKNFCEYGCISKCFKENVCQQIEFPIVDDDLAAIENSLQNLEIDTSVKDRETDVDYFQVLCEKLENIHFNRRNSTENLLHNKMNTHLKTSVKHGKKNKSTKHRKTFKKDNEKNEENVQHIPTNSSNETNHLDTNALAKVRTRCTKCKNKLKKKRKQKKCSLVENRQEISIKVDVKKLTKTNTLKNKEAKNKTNEKKIRRHKDKLDNKRRKKVWKLKYMVQLGGLNKCLFEKPGMLSVSSKFLFVTDKHSNINCLCLLFSKYIHTCII